MSTKTLVVLGATGGQGGSVVRSFLGQEGWKIRGVTRDPTSTKARALVEQGVEVVQGDANDKASLVSAFQNATAIFAVTDFWVPFLSSLSAKEVQDLETAQGRNIVDAASTIPTLEHFIWSTLPSGNIASGGALSVPHFEGKFVVDDYVKSSPLKDRTTFLWVGYYAGNFHFGPFQPTKLIHSGVTTYSHIMPVPPNTPMDEVVDHSSTIGLVVTAIISQPEKTLGKYVWASNGEKTTLGEMFALWGEVAGVKDWKYIQVTDESFESLYGKVGVEVGLMFKLWGQYGWPAYTSKNEVLRPEDLGVTGLKTLREYLEEQDWSAYL